MNLAGIQPTSTQGTTTAPAPILTSGQIVTRDPRRALSSIITSPRTPSKVGCLYCVLSHELELNDLYSRYSQCTSRACHLEKHRSQRYYGLCAPRRVIETTSATNHGVFRNVHTASKTEKPTYTICKGMWPVSVAKKKKLRKKPITPLC
jgi:hypothetical protein